MLMNKRARKGGKTDNRDTELERRKKAEEAQKTKEAEEAEECEARRWHAD